MADFTLFDKPILVLRFIRASVGLSAAFRLSLLNFESDAVSAQQVTPAHL